jgi:Flp pilus assembly protein TadB
MDRHLIAYLLLAALVAAAVAGIVYARLQRDERAYRRHQKRQRAAREKLRQEQGKSDLSTKV